MKSNVGMAKAFFNVWRESTVLTVGLKVEDWTLTD